MKRKKERTKHGELRGEGVRPCGLGEDISLQKINLPSASRYDCCESTCNIAKRWTIKPKKVCLSDPLRVWLDHLIDWRFSCCLVIGIRPRPTTVWFSYRTWTNLSSLSDLIVIIVRRQQQDATFKAIIYFPKILDDYFWLLSTAFCFLVNRLCRILRRELSKGTTAGYFPVMISTWTITRPLVPSLVYRRRRWSIDCVSADGKHWHDGNLSRSLLLEFLLFLSAKPTRFLVCTCRRCRHHHHHQSLILHGDFRFSFFFVAPRSPISLIRVVRSCLEYWCPLRNRRAM